MHTNTHTFIVFLFTLLCLLAEGETQTVVKVELGEETGLVEEDLVAVSYMGDELDLETVGDIIAIIEEKVHTVFICKRLPFSFMLNGEFVRLKCVTGFW